eukprot:1152288-Pelagomonas_calceolata.AAC.6
MEALVRQNNGKAVCWGCWCGSAHVSCMDGGAREATQEQGLPHGLCRASAARSCSTGLPKQMDGKSGK